MREEENANAKVVATGSLDKIKRRSPDKVVAVKYPTMHRHMEGNNYILFV